MEIFEVSTKFNTEYTSANFLFCPLMKTSILANDRQIDKDHENYEKLRKASLFSPGEISVKIINVIDKNNRLIVRTVNTFLD